MAIAQLDDKTALIVIDLQNGIVALAQEEDVKSVIQNANKLIGAFHAASLPVVLVNVAGGAAGRIDLVMPARTMDEKWSALVEALVRDEREILLTKRNWGAFINSDLDQQFKQLGVTQVVVIGISTSIGVESTARQAFELGYNVILCTDAMTDSNLDNHAHSIKSIFPRLAETGTTEDLLNLL
ncbi:isochorismatase family protein [Vibrio ziniensis]|uniref:Isochorismatase family protein n=1 Tax=Vibrio ziniensis TaxID=2711221 RepID=A0A6G7CG36_9VIBR|nr:isochorismatase family protein [Vibrio ziniensis]QIH41062.1 isochorismatase family protein [Vibrio ziniensis]